MPIDEGEGFAIGRPCQAVSLIDDTAPRSSDGWNHEDSIGTLVPGREGDLRAIGRPARTPLHVPEIEEEVSRGLIAVAQILGEALPHDPPELGRHRERAWKRRRSIINNGMRHLGSAGRGKGQRSRQQLVQHDAEAEQIAPVIDALAPSLLKTL
jgi:hypothetical protein